jgi:hypothetical protein
MKLHFSTRSVALMFGILLAFVLAQAVSTWHDAVSHPWANLNTDQHVLGSVYEKITNPDSLQRDYIFQNEKSYAYYTPSFMLLVENIARLTNRSYLKSLAILQGPILALYLVAAYLLFQQVSGSSLVGTILAFLSINGYSVLKDFWSVVGLENMLARTIALPVVMVASLTFFRILLFPGQSQRWLWAITGLLIGLTANLHPPTGITFALAIGFTTLLGWKRLTGNKLRNLSLLVGCTVVAGMPIILHALQNTRGSEIPDFQAFANAYIDRVSMFPFRLPAYGRIASLEPTYQLAVGFFWLPLTLVSLFAMKPNLRSWTVWPFILVQVVYFWLIIARYSDLHSNAIAVIIIFYVWHWRRKDEERELVWLYFLASIIFVSYFLAVALRACWLYFEMDALTTLVSQLPRGARLLTLPVLLIGAKLSGDLFNRWKKLPSKGLIWIEFLAIISLAVFEKPSGVHILLAGLFSQRNRLPEWRLTQPAVFAAWSGFSAFAAAWLILGDHLLALALVGITVGVGIWLSSHYSLTAWSIRLGGVSAVVFILLILVSPFSGTLDVVKEIIISTTPSLVAVVIVGTGLFLLFGRLDNRAGRQLAGYILVPLLMVTGLQLSDATGVEDLANHKEPGPSPEFLVGSWARHNTPPDALFFTSDLDGSAFRFWAQRSIVMSYKDLGVFVAFSRPSELIALTERWQRLVQLSGDGIISDPEVAGTDYVIIRSDDEHLSLPVVYSDEYTIVYLVD